MKRILLISLLCLTFAPAATAMPGNGGDRFAAADGDKDGFLSREEFSAAFPGLKKEAFAIIDADRDGRVSRQEWQAFSSGHATGGMGGGMGGNAHPPAGGTGGLPLLPIPRQESRPEQTPPSASQPAPALPLLAPPAK